eukprot:CAMPEP_0177771896 /NCGR_PEP_ID=MMETSP0491_2-20121128/11887_1 /TAXON_ID=63592 /ORGANISM="Tetraselmis chuii, Strain PLY429" /LENGTH=356 /DNA_ID=CAMNT_0019289577 /DNA_START=705 /DNA_END=1772 /DNA_ORIENTATION=+
MGCLDAISSKVWQNGAVIVLLTAALLAVQAIGMAGVDTERLCLEPRTATGLLGLLTSPFVHKSWIILISNLIGLWTLGFLLLMQGRMLFSLTYLWLSIMGGFMVYTMGRPGTHCGLAGELFGFFSFLVFAVFWQRPISVRTLIALIAALFLYGGSMFFELLIPVGSSTWHSSWEAKMFGFIAGVAWAILYYKIIMRSATLAPYFSESAAVEQAKKSNEKGVADVEKQTPPKSPEDNASARSQKPAHLMSPGKKGGFGFFATKKKEPPLHTQEERAPAPQTVTASPLYDGSAGQVGAGAWGSVGYASHTSSPEVALGGISCGATTASSSEFQDGGYYNRSGQTQVVGGWSHGNYGAW